MAGVVLTLMVILGAAAQSKTVAAMVQPFVVDINQSVPVSLTLALVTNDGEEITTTVPVTLGINLQVQVNGTNTVTLRADEAQPVSVAVQQINSGEENADDLAIPYTIAVDSSDIEFTEWTTYSDTNDQFNISAVVKQAAGTDPISDIATTVRFFDQNGKLISVDDVPNVAHGLKPGGINRFEHRAQLTAQEIGRYEVEFQVVR
jgi:hypothetical protein